MSVRAVRSSLPYPGGVWYNCCQELSGKQMKVSTKGDYGIRALIELAHRYGEVRPTQSSEIAARQKVPESYLEQLLTTLRRAGFIRSVRGPQGGHALIRDPRELRVTEVIEALEGPI